MLSVIIKREYFNIMKSKGTKWMLIILALLVVCGSLALRFFVVDAKSDDQDQSSNVGGNETVLVANSAKDIAPFLEAFGIKPVMTDKEPAVALEKNNPDKAEYMIGGNPPKFEYYASNVSLQSNSAFSTKSAIKEALKTYTLQKAHVNPQIQHELLTITQAEFVPASDKGDAISELAGIVIAIVGVSISLFFIILSMQGIASGILEEKSSRVVEVILSTVRPRTLLLGKLIGVGGGLMTLSLLTLGLISGGLWFSGIFAYIPALNVNIAYVILTLIFWTVLGYFTIAAMIGGAAATVSRQEDFGGLNTLFMFVLFVPFYTCLFWLQNGIVSEGVANILSYVPFFSPFMMQSRMFMGTAGWMEIVGAIAINLVAIYLLTLLAGKVYERSILRMGERVKLSQIFRKAA